MSRLLFLFPLFLVSSLVLPANSGEFAIKTLKCRDDSTRFWYRRAFDHLSMKNKDAPRWKDVMGIGYVQLYSGTSQRIGDKNWVTFLFGYQPKGLNLGIMCYVFAFESKTADPHSFHTDCYEGTFAKLENSFSGSGPHRLWHWINGNNTKFEDCEGPEMPY